MDPPEKPKNEKKLEKMNERERDEYACRVKLGEGLKNEEYTLLYFFSIFLTFPKTRLIPIKISTMLLPCSWIT